MDRTLLFPEVKTWNELFAETSPWTFKPGEQTPPITSIEGEPYLHANGKKRVIPRMNIGGYCTISAKNPRFRGVRITKLADGVLSRLHAAMVIIEEDTTYFSVNVYDDGTALVTINNNRINGDRWLAMIDANTIPQFSE